MPKNVDYASNAILGCLKGKDRALALQTTKIVDFKVRQNVYRPEERITDAYFPLSAVFSVVARMKDGAMIEVGTIGREGTTGVPLVMGSETTANESFCQVPGKAWKMPAATFRSLLATSQVFRQYINRYLQAYVNMLGQLAACNRLHTVYERCARWLLMTRDRVDVDEIPLTQEFLAMMLGTGQSGVAIAAATLQHAGFIKYSRGTIKIRDRSGLENAVCECYQVARDQFDGLLRTMPGARAKMV